MRLGVALGMKRSLLQDHAEVVKAYYQHCFIHRSLFSQTEKQALSQIFQHMEINKICPHLDIFKETRRNESQKMAAGSILKGAEIPEHISVNFDFENKVVIFLNKKSQQTILLYGNSLQPGQSNTQANEGAVRFGFQLMDQFKPSTILVQESPLQLVKQAGFTENGLIHPAVNDSIFQLKGEDFENFIKHSVVEQESVYSIDSGGELVSKVMQDGSGTQLVDYASYAHYHVKRNLKHINRESI